MEGLEGFKKELHKRMHFEEGSQDEDIYKSKKKAIQYARSLSSDLSAKIIPRFLKK